MAQGTVKWFNTQKGYGFIQPDDGGADVFVHISAVEKAGLRGLNEGQKISYDVTMDKGKNSATNSQNRIDFDLFSSIKTRCSPASGFLILELKLLEIRAKRFNTNRTRLTAMLADHLNYQTGGFMQRVVLT